MNEEFENSLVELSEWKREHFFGKYRGIVKTVGEGDDLGYISAIVPEVFGEIEVQRIVPAVPFAGAGHGLIALPEAEDGVWIEFEAGKTSKPIWTGFWWTDKEMDEMPEPKGALVRAFITTAGHKLILDDKGGKVTLLHSDGAEMTMTGGDITISIGQATIKMSDSEISLSVGSGAAGVIKISSSGVDIGSGAVKTM